LEDRRVLYAPESMELPERCTSSVIDIRRFLTAELQHGADEDDLSASIRAMRAACRKFLDAVNGDVARFGGHHGHWASWRFNGALGELRGVFGLHLARIAVQYGIEIEDDLGAILPGEDVAPES
jgi:hypothetical protein